jgi:vacuolar protein sorting-associated protein 13A/C
MFEGLLERILLSYFGKFIEGVDKRHIKLGVLSGNLIIENVSLKREAIDALDLPIKLRYSSISKLQLLVPWSKLSTSR